MNWTYIAAAFVGGFIFQSALFLFKRFVMADKVEVKAKDLACHGSPTWWWHIVSRNGQIVATSETYDSPGNARKMGKKKAKQYGLGYVDHTKGDK